MKFKTNVNSNQVEIHVLNAEHRYTLLPAEELSEWIRKMF